MTVRLSPRVVHTNIPITIAMFVIPESGEERTEDEERKKKRKRKKERKEIQRTSGAWLFLASVYLIERRSGIIRDLISADRSFSRRGSLRNTINEKWEKRGKKNRPAPFSPSTTAVYTAIRWTNDGKCSHASTSFLSFFFHQSRSRE